MIGIDVPAPGSDDASRGLTEGALLALRDVLARLHEVIAEEDLTALISEVMTDIRNPADALPSKIADSYEKELRAIQSEVSRADDGALALIQYLDRLIAASNHPDGD